jgi:hypothetical protein
MSKKLISIIVIILLVTLAFTGCGKAAATTGTKLGFGAVTTIAKSTNATAEKDGNVQTYSFLAAVTLDAGGKIVNVWIDSIQSNVAIDKAGAVKTDLKSFMQTKRELGDKYGMKAASKLGKEWYQEADELEKFLIGKTKADVEAIKLDAGKPTDLSATVSITVTEYLDAVKKAIANAQ